MRTYLLVGAVALASVGMAGCQRQVDCTLVGCDSQVVYDLGEALPAGTYEVEACVDRACATVEVDVASQAYTWTGDISIDRRTGEIVHRLPSDRDFDGTHTVSLYVTDGRGGVVADLQRDDVGFERSQPNGPQCPPVCWVARVAL